MSAPTNGVFPVYNNVFKVGTAGIESAETDMVTISEMTTFSVALDNVIQTWTPMTTEGWSKSLQTGKSLSITLNGNRDTGDDGNDYVAGMAFKSGRDVETKFAWTLPDGVTVTFDCLISVTNIGGGNSTDVGGLSFDVKCNGKPTVTTGTTP